MNDKDLKGYKTVSTLMKSTAVMMSGTTLVVNDMHRNLKSYYGYEMSYE